MLVELELQLNTFAKHQISYLFCEQNLGYKEQISYHALVEETLIQISFDGQSSVSLFGTSPIGPRIPKYMDRSEVDYSEA